MGRSLLGGVLLLISIGARADGCALPAADAGAPYASLAQLSKRDFYLLLNEYMFVHSWSEHGQALSAGFAVGSRVYGQVLTSGGRFDPKVTAAWRRAYTKSGHSQFLSELGGRIDIATVDRAVVEWILGTCLGSKLWSETRAINACRFTFAAGLTPVDGPSPKVQPTRFEVHGGRCDQWPARSLSVKGDAVRCVRSGEAQVTLELATDQGGVTRQTVPALRAAQLPPEPVQENRLSEPASEVFRLWRSRDYKLQQLGRGCPTCSLYAADIRPSVANATILRAETVSSSGAGWQPCPAGFRCGVYEFSPPDNPRLSGCAGVAACRVWRLAEGNAEASDVIQITYQTPETVCSNCPGDQDFETAHRKWEEARAAIPGRCGVFPDSPPQSPTSSVRH